MKLDKFHYHEAMDRAHVIQTMIDQLLLEHPVALRHSTFASLVQDLDDAAYKVYHAAAMLGEKKK